MYATRDDEPEACGSVPSCVRCGSERVVKQAWACFNRYSGLWELEHVRERAYCHVCEEKTNLKWSLAEHMRNARVRDLNDLFRTTGKGNGSYLITSGLQAKGADFALAAVEAVRGFSAFTDENDPLDEHDCGAIELEGEKVFFKIDYYDPTCSQGSENPANEALTHRVLTIMLASEY